MSATPAPQPVAPAAKATDSAVLAAPLKLFRADKVRLVVVVPALNEQPTIADVIRRIPRAIEGVDEVGVLVVDDGSTDRTATIARDEGAVVVCHPRCCGVGAAFQTGLRKAIELGADLVVSIDGDGQFNPEDIPKLAAPILRGEADFVTASRFLDPALIPDMPPLKLWGNRQVSRLISRLTGSTFHDVSCGMRAYGRQAALSLSLLERFTYTHEVFLYLAAKRMKLVEVPVAVRGRRAFGKSRVASNLVRYAIKTLRTVFRFYRDHYPMRLFGSVAVASFLAAAPILGFCTVHYLTTGSFSPYKWAGFAGAALACGGIAALVLAVLGDMLVRQRTYLEELLYHTRALVAANQRRDR